MVHHGIVRATAGPPARRAARSVVQYFLSTTYLATIRDYIAHIFSSSTSLAMSL